MAFKSKAGEVNLHPRLIGGRAIWTAEAGAACDFPLMGFCKPGPAEVIETRLGSFS